MVGNLRGEDKVRLGSAQDPIKGTSTLDNPNASRCAPRLIVNVLKPFAWLRSGNSLQGLGQSPILNLIKISLSSLPLGAPAGQLKISFENFTSQSLHFLEN